VSRRKLLLIVFVGLLLAGSAYWLFRFPSDRTPEGAYARIALAVTRDRPEDFFAYLETRAQWAAYTVRDYRKKAVELVARTYPQAERERLLAEWGPFAEAPDGADVFALYARQRGWLNRLRKDLSGIAGIEAQGERATIETARGTRYSFRRRENGIWGLTMFTGELEAEAEKAARDFAVVERAAQDYERAGK